MTETPFAVQAVQTAGYAVGVVFMILGVRAGTVRMGGTRWTRREKINLRLVWAGVILFAATSVFGLIAGIVWMSWFRIIAGVITVAICGFLVWGINRLQRDIKSGAINDYADEIADDEEDDD